MNSIHDSVHQERQEMLLTQPEVEVSDKEFNEHFGPLCEDEKLVKREVSGRLADEIRTRFGVKDQTPVFISELEGDAQIGDETWEHFTELLIECGGHKMDFDRYSEDNNFAAMLLWLGGAPDSE